MIKNAVYVSIWDDEVEVKSSCKVDTKTKEVFDIKTVDIAKYGVCSCTDEYIEFEDEDEHYYIVFVNDGTLQYVSASEID